MGSVLQYLRSHFHERALRGAGIMSVRFIFLGTSTQTRGLVVASLIMATFAVFAILGQLWFHRRMISEFTLDGEALRFRTLGISEMQTRHIPEIAKISDWQG